eukprot:Nk52_evm2s312 gene=Nk52_evmTU2s312
MVAKTTHLILPSILIYLIFTFQQSCASPINEKPLHLEGLKNQLPTIRLATSIGTALDPLLLDKKWYPYNIGTGVAILQSPWKSSIVEEKLIDPESVSKFAYRFNEDTFGKSEDIRAELEGQYMIAKVDASLNILNSVSSTTTKTEVVAYIKRGEYTVHIWDDILASIDDPSALMTSEAYELARNKEYETFLEKYGTHFIISKEYGCQAELLGEYSFTSSEEKHKFETQVGAGFESGEFSAKISVSIDKIAETASQSKGLKVTLKGDYASLVQLESDDDPTKLEAWASAFTRTSCDGKMPILGPPRNLTDFQVNKIDALKKKSWTPSSWKGGSLDTTYYAKIFMEEMQEELSEYVRLNRQYVPSFLLKAKACTSPSSCANAQQAVDLFRKPQFSFVVVGGGERQSNVFYDGLFAPDNLNYLAFQGTEQSLLSWVHWDKASSSYICKVQQESGSPNGRIAFTAEGNTHPFEVSLWTNENSCAKKYHVEFTLEPIDNEHERFDGDTSYFPLKCDAATRL